MKKTVKRIFGACLVASPMTPLIILSYKHVKPINATGSSSVLPLMEKIANKYNIGDILVTGGGSGKGLADIAAGNTDLGNMSSDKKSSILKPENKSDWKSRKIRTITIAIDSIAIALKLPPGLSIAKNDKMVINGAAVYRLYDQDFNDTPTYDELIETPLLGPQALKNTKVQGFGRKGGKKASGTSDGFFGGLKQFKPKAGPDLRKKLNYTHEDDNNILKTNEANSIAYDRLLNAEHGLAYISLVYINKQTHKEIYISNIKEFQDNNNQVLTNVANSINGKYKWKRPFNVAFSQNTFEATKAFLKWMLSPKGQKAIDEAGFIPLSKQDAEDQKATFTKTDFELYEDADEKLKALAFGLDI